MRVRVTQCMHLFLHSSTMQRFELHILFYFVALCDVDNGNNNNDNGGDGDVGDCSGSEKNQQTQQYYIAISIYYHSLSDFVCLAATETHSFNSSEFIRIFPNVRASEFLIVPQPSNTQIIPKIEIIDDHVCMRACVHRVLTLLISRELQNDLAANSVRKHTFVFGINLII